MEIETALRLVASTDNVDVVLINKLKTRQCKAYIILGHFHKAIEVVGDDKDLLEDILSLGRVAQSGLTFYTTKSKPNQTSIEYLKKIVDVLPRFKPQLYVVACLISSIVTNRTTDLVSRSFII